MHGHVSATHPSLPTRCVPFCLPRAPSELHVDDGSHSGPGTLLSPMAQPWHRTTHGGPSASASAGAGAPGAGHVGAASRPTHSSARSLAGGAGAGAATGRGPKVAPDEVTPTQVVHPLTLAPLRRGSPGRSPSPQGHLARGGRSTPPSPQLTSLAASRAVPREDSRTRVAYVGGHA